MSLKNIAWFVGYLITMLCVFVALNSYRSNAIADYGTDEAGAKWEEWREAAGEMGKAGPVKRSKPKSVEPPSLVLMRDHFTSCLGISLLLSSCLYGWFMICVRGALQPVSMFDENLDPQDPDERAPPQRSTEHTDV